MTELVKVYTCFGGGLIHSLVNINGTLGQIDRYPETDFELIISMRGGAFGEVFFDYFDLLCPKNVKKTSYVMDNICPDKFTILLDPEQLTTGSVHYVYRGPSNFSYCRLNSDTMRQIRDLTCHLDFNNLIGVHFRNTDYQNDIQNIIEKTERLRVDNNPIFLATDDIEAVKVFTDRFGDSLIHLAKLEPLDNSKNFHYHRGSIMQKDKLLDCLVDLYVLAKVKTNVYSEKSSWCRFITTIKKQNIIIDLV